MTNKRRVLFTFVAALLAGAAHAQDQQDWLDNTMFASGKIKVVATVIAVVFVLIVIYLISIDRKVKKLEQRDINKSK